MTIKSLPTLASAAALLVGLSSVAQAQQPTAQPTQPLQSAGPERPSGALGRGTSVVDRPRPEFDPLGIRAGGFLIFPQVEAGLTYDSNVYATQNDERSDFLFEVSPSVTARTDLNRHELRLRAGADIGRYIDETDQNYLDYLVEAAGRYDIATQTAANGRLGYRKDHETGDDPDSPQGIVEAGDYYVGVAEAGLRQGFNRFGVAGTVGVQTYDYEDVTRANGDIADQDGRDRNVYTASLRGSYEIQQDFEAFVRLTYDRIEYDQDLQSDSSGWELGVGTDFDLTGLVTGSVFLGYSQRDYERAALKDPSGISAGVDVDWAVTQLTTVNFQLNREFQETTTAGASARQRTTVGVGVDHELLRNLILNADAAYRFDDYKGVAREDDYILLGAGATYLLNRNYYLRGGYDFITRDSNAPTVADYDRHLVTLRLGARL